MRPKPALQVGLLFTALLLESTMLGLLSLPGYPDAPASAHFALHSLSRCLYAFHFTDLPAAGDPIIGISK
jgi:hypothetical protein